MQNLMLVLENAKRFIGRKLEGPRTFSLGTKGGKQHATFFQRIRNQHQILHFLITVERAFTALD
jgi:hypothetical protein